MQVRNRFYSPDGDGANQGQPAPDIKAKEPKSIEPDNNPVEPTPQDVDPNQAFLDELNRLASQISATQVASTATSSGEGEPKSGPGPKVPDLPSDGDEFSSFIQDPSKFQSYIQGVVKQAKEEAKNEILKTIPSELKKVVKEEVSFDRAANDFWIENSDLIPARPFLAARASFIAAQNPNLTPDEVFKKAGKEVRESLTKMGVKLGTEGTVRRPGARASEPGSPTSKDAENDVKSIALKQLKL